MYTALMCEQIAALRGDYIYMSSALPGLYFLYTHDQQEEYPVSRTAPANCIPQTMHHPAKMLVAR